MRQSPKKEAQNDRFDRLKDWIKKYDDQSPIREVSDNEDADIIDLKFEILD